MEYIIFSENLQDYSGNFVTFPEFSGLRFLGSFYKMEASKDPTILRKEELSMAQHSQLQVDGVDYRRAKLWQIILVAFNAFNGMAVYFLIGLASYSASIGYGIATAVVGGLLTFTRIFDAITDPILAFLYDRFNTPWGKVRPLMLIGWLIESAGLHIQFPSNNTISALSLAEKVKRVKNFVFYIECSK
jgi:hypothetical protein